MLSLFHHRTQRCEKPPIRTLKTIMVVESSFLLAREPDSDTSKVTVGVTVGVTPTVLVTPSVVVTPTVVVVTAAAVVVVSGVVVAARYQESTCHTDEDTLKTKLYNHKSRKELRTGTTRTILSSIQANYKLHHKIK